jgi:hypothetical protein
MFCLQPLPLSHRRTTMKLSRSYILRVESDGSVRQFWLQDIKTGERFKFQSWQTLKAHLQSAKPSGLK